MTPRRQINDRPPGRLVHVSDASTSPLSGLGTLDRRTLREQILTRLRDAVSTGELAPGTHLAEIELSASLGVSRGTLREALRHLQQEGLLVSDQRGRLTVRVVTEREVRDIFTVRYGLEALAFEEIARLEDRSPVERRIRAALDALERADGFADRVRADLDLHETIIDASGNETLLQSWRHVSGLARAALTAGGAEAAMTNMAVERHTPLVDLVASGDADAGRAFLRQHMDEAADKLVARMREQH